MKPQPPTWLLKHVVKDRYFGLCATICVIRDLKPRNDETHEAQRRLPTWKGHQLSMATSLPLLIPVLPRGTADILNPTTKSSDYKNRSVDTTKFNRLSPQFCTQIPQDSAVELETLTALLHGEFRKKIVVILWCTTARENTHTIRGGNVHI